LSLLEPHIPNALQISALASTVAGVWQIWQPAGFITLGAALGFVGWALDGDR
jgi:hypothetical protein